MKLQLPGSIPDSGTVEGYIGELLFNVWLTGFVSVDELQHAVAVMTAKSVMTFRILTMAVNVSRLTTGTMNINAGSWN